MKTIFALITSRTQPVKEKLNPTYFTLYCNRLVAALANQYLGSVYKLKRVNELSAHQFQLDIEELKNVLTNLPGGTSSPSYVAYVA